MAPLVSVANFFSDRKKFPDLSSDNSRYGDEPHGRIKIQRSLSFGSKPPMRFQPSSVRRESINPRCLAYKIFTGAGDEARTRNFQLGKLTLYH